MPWREEDLCDNPAFHQSNEPTTFLAIARSPTNPAIKYGIISLGLTITTILVRGQRGMKEWSPDHPKARLMTRKRGDILAAAKTAFLDTGYGGTSMESIARTANVSIMTLYRHAESKDDLFGAVISNACTPTDDDERAELAGILLMPLVEALVESAIHMQSMLTAEDNVALLRVVLAEATRFPQLAELAYVGFIVRLEDVTAWILSKFHQTRALPEGERRRLGRLFVERIVGPDMLRVLLGLPGPTDGERRHRAEKARDDILRELGHS